MDQQRPKATTNDFTFYGFPDECKKFEQRHPLWQEIMRNLECAMNIAFTREQITKGAQDKFVYFFGRVCLEDFMEKFSALRWVLGSEWDFLDT